VSALHTLSVIRRVTRAGPMPALDPTFLVYLNPAARVVPESPDFGGPDADSYRARTAPDPPSLLRSDFASVALV